MCFGSLKGESSASHLDQGQTSNAKPVSISSGKEPKSSKMPQKGYSAPSGPPPSHAGYSASTGFSGQQEYSAPSGPPPSQYAPPSGPPPSQDPQHDWQTAVPDTSLLPPPPTLGHETSPTNNATETDAIRGETFCKANPLYPPQPLESRTLADLDSGNIGLIKSQPYSGDLKQLRHGSWKGKTKAGAVDSCLISNIPLYVVDAHSPFHTRRPKTIYYEVRILSTTSSSKEVTLALGFVAQPYPTFRLPGWERASLGVHGDDGRKYINDKWGGKDFTAPFKIGETLGIGMKFSPKDQAKGEAPPEYVDATAIATGRAEGGVAVEVFFTRDGVRVDGWDLHEESDAAEDLSVFGLEGHHDLFAAVGTFEGVEFEVVFNAAEHKFRS